MKKIKNNYTNFILTVIAVAMIGILFKGQITKPAHAAASVDQVCVAGHRFVVYQGSIVQFFQQVGTAYTVPVRC